MELQVPFFAELSDAKIDDAAHHSTLVRYQRGDVIVEKGSMGRAFYVIVHGEVTGK